MSGARVTLGLSMVDDNSVNMNERFVVQTGYLTNNAAVDRCFRRAPALTFLA